MKKLIFISTIIGVILSCSKGNDNQNFDNSELMGKWNLIETFQDPGNGSGTYESIESEKTIEIFNNGTFTINGPLCGLSASIGENISGNVRNYSSYNILVPNEECELNNPSTEYRVAIENSDLVIYWTACIEGCAQKYQKLNTE